MNVSIPVKGTVRRTFEFVLKDGQKIELEQDEAEYIRDFLSSEIPKAPLSIAAQVRTEIKQKAENLEKLLGTSTNRGPVPSGFVKIGSRQSEPKGNAPVYTYYYYKDAAGNYGYQIENHSVHSFLRVGKIGDVTSNIYRILRSIPTDKFVSKSYLQKNRVLGNTQTIKAIVDILEIEKYIEISPANDARTRAKFRRLVKLQEPEVGNNHELKVQALSSGPKVGVSP